MSLLRLQPAFADNAGQDIILSYIRSTIICEYPFFIRVHLWQTLIPPPSEFRGSPPQRLALGPMRFEVIKIQLQPQARPHGYLHLAVTDDELLAGCFRGFGGPATRISEAASLTASMASR